MGKLFAFYLFTSQHRGLTPIFNLYLLKHLPHNGFNMLVVDFHALQTVNILNFLYQIFCQSLYAQNIQDIMRNRRAIQQQIAFADHITFIDCQ